MRALLSLIFLNLSGVTAYLQMFPAESTLKSILVKFAKVLLLKMFNTNTRCDISFSNFPKLISMYSVWEFCFVSSPSELSSSSSSFSSPLWIIPFVDKLSQKIVSMYRPNLLNNKQDASKSTSPDCERDFTVQDISTVTFCSSLTFIFFFSLLFV